MWFWIKVIFLWTVHLKIAVDVIAFCILPIHLGYSSIARSRNKYINIYNNYSKKSFLVKFIGDIVAHLVGTLILGIPVFLFYSYFITNKEKEKYFVERKSPYLWDVKYVINKEYFMYAITNLFCKIMPIIIYIFFNILKNYVKCAVTGAYAEQHLKEVKDVDNTDSNLETTLMKKYLKLSISCLGSICYDSLNFIIMTFKNIWRTLGLIRASFKLISWMSVNYNKGKIGHTENHYILETTTRKNGFTRTTREKKVDYRDITDLEYVEKLDDVSYIDYTVLLGEYTDYQLVINLFFLKNLLYIVLFNN